jgi:hypothetical protein
MRLRGRLIFLALSLIVLIVIGRIITGGFGFLLKQFWFTAGLFLLILLVLIDQPYFSKDANIFVNGTTGWVSLLLVDPKDRSSIWWLFFIWATYLILSSYVLMWARSRPLAREPQAVQAFSRVNRQIGRPEALFSAFFLWGCIQNFGMQSTRLSAFLIFWAVFMILNVPSLAQTIDSLFEIKIGGGDEKAGALLGVISPRIAEIALRADLPDEIVGRHVTITTFAGKVAASAVLIDDRILAGQRIGKVAITSTEQAWSAIGVDSGHQPTVDLVEDTGIHTRDQSPVSVVDVGSDISKMVFHVHPNLVLQAGEVLWVQIDKSNKAFYQVVAGQIAQVGLSQGNAAQSVRVSASQLGVWDHTRCRFEPVTWVAPAGQLVYRATAASAQEQRIPSGHVVVGKVPNSDFPVHVNIQDTITHNTAIIGVTGSGKSYLAFHLIEAMVAAKIKVLILDLSRQHYSYLGQLTPTPLKQETDVGGWMNSESLIGIHQYALDAGGYPLVTSKFAGAAFAELSKTKLTPGINEPARLCVVFEEAHSLIPEWNQVAEKGDEHHVNKTARIILQGRKYGMGSLIITQRTANVTKTILNQCNTIFALQSFDQTGLDFLRNYMGDDYAQAISTLPARNAILVGRASSSARPILFSIPDFSARWTGPPQETQRAPSGAVADSGRER